MSRCLSPSSRRFMSVLWIGGILGAILGCGKDPPERLVPVAGKVTVAGVPLTSGSVSFRPDAARGNPSLHHPTGEIDALGNYQLVTGRKKGAPPGWYKVLVFASKQDNARLAWGGPVPPQWVVHAKYTREQTTDLILDVVATPAAGAYDLQLTK